MKDVGANDAAFPTRYGNVHGMSLRDWFAGQALAGILANNTASQPEWNALRAYEQANAMMHWRGG